MVASQVNWNGNDTWQCPVDRDRNGYGILTIFRFWCCDAVSWDRFKCVAFSRLLQPMVVSFLFPNKLDHVSLLWNSVSKALMIIARNGVWILILKCFWNLKILLKIIKHVFLSFPLSWEFSSPFISLKSCLSCAQFLSRIRLVERLKDWGAIRDNKRPSTPLFLHPIPRLFRQFPRF